MDFIYERRRLPIGVKVEEVTGGGRYKGRVWLEIARQIYCENGKDGYRELGHFASGAPFLYGADERISISHTEGCLVVATKAVAPDTDLREFTPNAALGVDVERSDREKVAALRERFLTDRELKDVVPDTLEASIIAWTCKEAMLKAVMDPAIDWHHAIEIKKLPTLSEEGRGVVSRGDESLEFRLYTYRSEGYIITVAY